MMTSRSATDHHQPSAPLRWVTLCQLDTIAPGRAKYVEFEDRGYSVVRNFGDESAAGIAEGNGVEVEVGVRIFADACPHAGASMSYGCVKQGCFICPAHQWGFRMADGRNPENPEIILPTYPCRIVNGAVQIGVRT